MRLTNYFLPLLKEAPKDADVISHQLMLRAGMVKQSSSGIYIWLPMGLAVLKKIEQIIREEQSKAGALEMLMPTIQTADIWKKSGRYEDYGKEMLRIVDRHDREMLYGPTNEEQITDLVSSFIKSYKNIPKIFFHIQWKFRDEIRPRFGVMRCREFLMKDAYSFDISESEGKRSYNKMFISYLKIFKKMELNAIPMKAESGPIGGNMSHEFIILAKTGESRVFIDKTLLRLEVPDDVNYNENLSEIVDKWTAPFAVTEDMYNEDEFHKNVTINNRVEEKGIEVGHVFFFGDKYTKPMNATIQNKEGKVIPLQCGSYGIGVSRLVAAIIEAHHDDKGIVWPKSVSPFDISLINLKPSNADVNNICNRIYENLEKNRYHTIYDDTDSSIGEKFSRMDLIGIPIQIIVGPNSIKEGKIEIKDRKTDLRKFVKISEIFNEFPLKD
ncbi:MAG: proline--tRNA ligase [Rhodobiaceae bacterium]|nr:proline--tRNA ligase [Rhodobiaceae bacterium]